MDSFYGAPRQPPRPPTINTIQRIPVVPEVSVLENRMFAEPRVFRPPVPRPVTFNTQKPQNVFQDSLMCKKHVRFKTNKENMLQAPDMKGKTFKQIYMANVPDRQLDLSVFEPPKTDKCDFLKECNPHNQFRPQLYDVTNNCMEMTKKCTEICTQTSPERSKCTEIAKSDDEPTIKDLYKIIQQQNEQILMLQRQVNNLKTTIRQPEIEAEPQRFLDKRFMQELGRSPKKNGLFSVDVKATSYEFSFRPQTNFRKATEFFEPATIKEIEPTTTKSNDNQNQSLHLDGSFDLKDSSVSNVQSIAVEMDKYRSSDEEEEEDEEIGLSFYNELMNQVKNALKNAQSECRAPSQKQELRNQTMNTVKQATLQHLKNIGVNLSPIQESSEVTRETSTDCSQTEVSGAVQQLLMKYLPPEKLAKVVNKPTRAPKMKDSNQELSFATLQYMKKYNLIDSDKAKKNPDVMSKFLDVTELRLQSKFV